MANLNKNFLEIQSYYIFKIMLELLSLIHSTRHPFTNHKNSVVIPNSRNVAVPSTFILWTSVLWITFQAPSSLNIQSTVLQLSNVPLIDLTSICGPISSRTIGSINSHGDKILTTKRQLEWSKRQALTFKHACIKNPIRSSSTKPCWFCNCENKSNNQKSKIYKNFYII